MPSPRISVRLDEATRGRLQALERPQGLVVLGHLPGQLGEPAFGLLAGIAGDGAPALEHTLDRCGQEGPRQR